MIYRIVGGKREILNPGISLLPTTTTKIIEPPYNTENLICSRTPTMRRPIGIGEIPDSIQQYTKREKAQILIGSIIQDLERMRAPQEIIDRLKKLQIAFERNGRIIPDSKSEKVKLHAATEYKVALKMDCKFNKDKITDITPGTCTFDNNPILLLDDSNINFFWDNKNNYFARLIFASILYKESIHLEEGLDKPEAVIKRFSGFHDFSTKLFLSSWRAGFINDTDINYWNYISRDPAAAFQHLFGNMLGNIENLKKDSVLVESAKRFLAQFIENELVGFRAISEFEYIFALDSTNFDLSQPSSTLGNFFDSYRNNTVLVKNGQRPDPNVLRWDVFTRIFPKRPTEDLTSRHFYLAARLNFGPTVNKVGRLETLRSDLSFIFDPRYYES